MSYTEEVAGTEQQARSGVAIVLPLHVVKGHLLVDVGGSVALVDTGSPVSFSQGGPLRVGGLEYACRVGQGVGFGEGASLLEYLARWLELPRLDFLVGMDVLGEYRVTVDIPGQRLLLEGTAGEHGTPIRLLSTPFGDAYPHVDVEIGGETRSALFDTGAWLAYVPADTVQGLAAADTEHDFLPGFGEFSTPVYRLKVGVPGCGEHEIDAGVLPSGPFSFILSTELLRDRAVEFDFPARRLRWPALAA